VSEKDVEKYFHRQVVKLGGTSRKFSSPSRVGVPDRIALLRFGVVWFVEIKDDDGTPTVRQIRELEEYNRLGHHTAIAYGNAGVDDVIREMEYSIVTARKGEFLYPIRFGY